MQSQEGRVKDGLRGYFHLQKHLCHCVYLLVHDHNLSYHDDLCHDDDDAGENGEAGRTAVGGFLPGRLWTTTTSLWI